MNILLYDNKSIPFIFHNGGRAGQSANLPEQTKSVEIVSPDGLWLEVYERSAKPYRPYEQQILAAPVLCLVHRERTVAYIPELCPSGTSSCLPVEPGF